MSTAETERSHYVAHIRPGSNWQIFDLREIWRFRDLLWTLGERDVKLRYRQTALGVFWILIQPLVAAGIFAFVFGNVARLSSEGLPYILFSYAGMVLWNSFSSTLLKSGGSLIHNSHLVSRIYFPRVILPLSTVITTLVDFLVSFAVLIIMLYAFQHPPTWTMLTVPFWVVTIVALGLGIGLMNAALTVRYRDVGNIAGVLMAFLLYASPIAYSVQSVPADHRTLFLMNPVASLLAGFRWAVFGKGLVPWGWVLYSVVFTVATIVVGALVFKSRERKFADVI